MKEFVFVRVKNLMNDQEIERREDSVSEFLSVKVRRKRVGNMVNEDKTHCLRDWILLTIRCHLGKNYVSFGIQKISQLFWHCDISSVTLLFGKELDLWHQHPFSWTTRRILICHFIFSFSFSEMSTCP